MVCGEGVTSVGQTTPELRICRMEAAHVAAAAALAEECFTEAWSEEGFQSDVDNSHAIPLVALCGTVLAGFLCGFLIYGEGTIRLLAVQPRYRRQGIASALLQALLEEGQKQRAEYFTLEVRESNRDAIRFYEGHGFEPAGRRRDFYTQPREDALLYTRRLTTPDPVGG